MIEQGTRELTGVSLVSLTKPENREAARAPRVDAWGDASPTDVWRCSLKNPPARPADLRGTLSTDELSRYAGLRSSRDRRRYAIARGVLRLVLARYVEESPRDLVFGYGCAGKPALRRRRTLTDGARVHFNLSHSDDLLLIAVSLRAPVGIDVERIRPLAHMEDIARRCFSIDAYRAIRGAPTQAVKTRRFFAAWTTTEARAKATGDGLWGAGRAGGRLERDGQRLERAGGWLERDREPGARTSGPSPVLFWPVEGFVAALAYAVPPTPATPRIPPVRFEQRDPRLPG